MIMANIITILLATNLLAMAEAKNPSPIPSFERKGEQRNLFRLHLLHLLMQRFPLFEQILMVLEELAALLGQEIGRASCRERV